jgi:hypothetical protein
VHHQVLDLDLAESLDRIGHAPQQRSNILLAIPCRIGTIAGP